MSDYKTFQNTSDFFQSELILAKSNLEKAKKSEALNFSRFIEPNESVFKFYDETYNLYINALFSGDIKNEEILLQEAIDWLAEASKDLVKFNRFCSEAREAGDLLELKLTYILKQLLEEQKKKADRCKRIADRRYDKPSAYKSGAIVRCRKGGIWKDLKETDDPQSGKSSPYGSGYARVREIIEKVIQEDESLRKWFSRKGAPGKEGGWVDCNAPIRKDGKITGYKSCGRKEGEKRSKYPSCRPTPSQCKTKGKGKKWGKTK